MVLGNLRELGEGGDLGEKGNEEVTVLQERRGFPPKGEGVHGGSNPEGENSLRI